MMGESVCLSKFLAEYIWLNVVATKYESIYSLKALAEFSLEELTNLAKKFNKAHKAYAGYIAGIAIKSCLEKFPEMNESPAGGAVSKMMEIVGIDEPTEYEID